MSSATHPQFPLTGIPQMGDVVRMEITYWPHGKGQKGMTRTEEGFVIYREAIGDNEFHIHLFNPNPAMQARTLIKKGDNLQCKWYSGIEHQVAMTWRPLIEFRQPR